MGEKNSFQPLTKQDRITVILYRAGIFISAVIICLSALLALKSVTGNNTQNYPAIISGSSMEIMLFVLYLGTGLSVFFIHLYVGKFYRMLKKIYYAAVICLGILFFLGNGNPAMPLFRIPPYGAILLMPLSLCLGFVTAKEAFCFKLLEGYILAIVMPAYIFLFSIGALNAKNAAFGLSMIAALFVLFMFRKIFMPVHYDIGDKSAYQP